MRPVGYVVGRKDGGEELFLDSGSRPSDALICLRDLYARTQREGAYIPSHPVVMRDEVLRYIDELEGKR